MVGSCSSANQLEVSGNDISQPLGDVQVRFGERGRRRASEDQCAMNFPGNSERYDQPTLSPRLGKGVPALTLKHTL